MILELTLEGALQRASEPLRDKIDKSITLIRKAAKLALKYNDNGLICAMSFGKDSQAVYHLAQLADVPYEGYFSPTTVDLAEVLRFGREYYSEVKWNKVNKSIYQLAFENHALPSRVIRFCCAEFKENKHPNRVVMLGVRRAEGRSRKSRNEVEVSSHKFSGDMDEFEKYSFERLRKKYKTLDDVHFERISKSWWVRCIDGKDQILINPILDWTDSEVWEFLNDVVRVPHCKVYDNGRHRVGCVMCPFAPQKQIMSDAREFPHVYWRWVGVVRAIREHKAGLFTDKVSKLPPPIENTLYKSLRNNEKPRFPLINPFGNEITDVSEMLVHWWMSKLSFKEWYDKYFCQPTLF